MCSSHWPLTLLSVPGNCLLTCKTGMSKTGHPQQSVFSKGRLLSDIHSSHWQRYLLESYERYRHPWHDSGPQQRITQWHVSESPSEQQIHQLLQNWSLTRLCSRPSLYSHVFCIAMDFIIGHISGSIEPMINNYWFPDLDYADDAALLVNDESKLYEALQSTDDTAAKLGLQVAWTKTKVQNLGSGQLPLPLSIQNQSIEVADDFCYIGSIFWSDAITHREVVKRIGLAVAAMNHLKPIWVQNMVSLPMCTRHLSLYCMAVRLGLSSKSTGDV